MAPSSVPQPTRGQRLALVTVMFLTTASLGFLQPFVPLYLEASGISREQLGLVAGLGTGLALLIQPLLGRLSDRLDARRPVMFAAACIAGCAYLSYRFANGLPAFIVLTALGVNGTGYLNVAAGVLVGNLVGGRSGGGQAYTRYRVWGSVGYVVVSLLTGLMVNSGVGARDTLSRAGLEPLFTWGPLLFFLIALVTLFVPDRRRSQQPSPPSADASRAEPDEELTDTAISPAENLRWFLRAFFLYQFSLYGATAYLSIYMKALGATSLWITGMFAAGVISEVLIMAQVGRWSDRYGRRPALAIPFLLLPVRLLFYIPATGPLWVLLVQTLHGLNYGIMGAIAVVFVNDLSSNQRRGVAQAQLAGVAGLATALGPVACGWLSQRLGMGWMFGTMALVGAAGAAVFFRRVHESHPAATALAGDETRRMRPLWRLLAAPPNRSVPAPGPRSDDP